jgi:hypothetical protein
MQTTAKIEWGDNEWLRVQEGHSIRWECENTQESYTGSMGYWCYNITFNSDSVKCPIPEVEKLYKEATHGN